MIINKIAKKVASKRFKQAFDVDDDVKSAPPGQDGWYFEGRFIDRKEIENNTTWNNLQYIFGKHLYDPYGRQIVNELYAKMNKFLGKVPSPSDVGPYLDQITSGTSSRSHPVLTARDFEEWFGEIEGSLEVIGHQAKNMQDVFDLFQKENKTEWDRILSSMHPDFTAKYKLDDMGDGWNVDVEVFHSGTPIFKVPAIGAGSEPERAKEIQDALDKLNLKDFPTLS